MKNKLHFVLLAMVVVFAASSQGQDIAQFWGNSTGGWRKLVPPEMQVESQGGDRPLPPSVGAAVPKVVCWSHLGSLPAAKLSPDETETLENYVRDGGILILAAAMPAALYAGESVFDIQKGTTLLGATRYDYSNPEISVSDTLQQITPDRTLLNSYPAGGGNHPGVGGLRTMNVLLGSDKVAKLGVNRIGKGAVLYSAPVPKDAGDYSELLRALIAELLVPEKLEVLFPLPESNAVAMVGTKRMHLALADGTDSRKASDFLVEKLKQATGKDFFYPIPDIDQLHIHVGRSPYTEEMVPDLDSLHPYGYVIKLQGNHLILAGRQPQGTVYAVNDFMKRFAGYRRFGAGELSEILPFSESITLPETLDFREEPDVDSYLLAYGPNSDFARSSRVTCQATHALDKLVPPSKYALSHPDYFPMIDGKRKVMKPEGKNGPWNPCTANPDLAALGRDYIATYFEKNPLRFGLPMGVNDGGGDCHCPECNRYYEEHGNQYIGLYNTVARELAQTHPDKLLAFIAYSRRGYAAPRGVKLEGNILVEITGMSRSAFGEMAGWREAGARHFGLYDYLYTFGKAFVVPRYYPQYMAAQWRNAHAEYGIRTIWAEYYPDSTVFSAPRQYVLDELAWDMNVDVDALLEDYFKSMYGPVAGAVQNLFDLFEEVYSRSPRADTPIFGRNNHSQMNDYRWEDIAMMDSFMDKIEAAASGADELVKRRVEVLKTAMTLSRFHLVSFLCSRDLEDIGDIAGMEQIDKIIESVLRGSKAIADLDAFSMPAEVETELFCGKSDLASFKNISAVAPLPVLERTADAAFGAASRFLAASGRDVAVFWQDRIEKDKISGIARTLVATQIFAGREQSENLVRNHSFEDSGKSDDLEEVASDHLVFQGTPGWRTWTFPNSTTAFFRDGTLASEGSFCAGIEENQMAGSLISYVRLEPNCRYRWTFEVRRNRGEEGFGMGSASVRMQDKNGWLDQGSAIKIDYPESCENNWVELTTTFTTPDSDSITGLLLLGAPHQATGSRTYFDNVRLVKIFDPKWNIE